MAARPESAVTTASGKTITSRDGQWTLTMCGDSWVTGVTHNPTGRTVPGRASVAAVRRRIADGQMLADLDQAGAAKPAVTTTWRRKPAECEAGVTSCGVAALLYPCGWRCDEHSPGAVRAAALAAGAGER